MDEVEADEKGDEDEAAKNDDDNDEGMDEAEESAEKKALMMEEIRLQKVRDIRDPLYSMAGQKQTPHLFFCKVGIALCLNQAFLTPLGYM